MLELNLMGMSPNLGPVHIRLNPNLPSLGEIEETANNTAGALDLPPFALAWSAAAHAVWSIAADPPVRAWWLHFEPNA